MPPVFPLNSANDADAIVENILNVYRRRGDEQYHGEAVSQLEHAFQAAELARLDRPHAPDFILAAFLHDYGHLCAEPGTTGLMDQYGVVEHESLGALYLKACHLSENIVRLVAGHVQAKRYLVATDPAYSALLSEASRVTLARQGGPMTAGEAADFETDPLFERHLHLRRLDERAKVPGRPAPDLFWVELLLRKHLLQRL